MRQTRVLAQAPSNIALIKYMGKKENSPNIPENPSLSMTLDQLRTYAEVTRQENGNGSFEWIAQAPANVSGTLMPMMKPEAVTRIRTHLERVRHATLEILPRFGVPVLRDLDSKWDWSLKSVNTFPASSGIASSASSFAAVTLATACACAEDPLQFQKIWDSDLRIKRALARVSRAGSGSSCRSFEGPWVYWENEDAAEMKTGMPQMAHFVVVVSSLPKKVSSGEAHGLAKTSPGWTARVDRLPARTEKMKEALSQGDIRTVARLAWAETWEMHSLFHSAQEPFTYWETETLDVIHDLAPLVKEESAPILTMDAGPNIHVIVPETERASWKTKLEGLFKGMKILEDGQGTGASILSVD